MPGSRGYALVAGCGLDGEGEEWRRGLMARGVSYDDQWQMDGTPGSTDWMVNCCSSLSDMIELVGISMGWLGR